MVGLCQETDGQLKILSTASHLVEIRESSFAGLPYPVPVFAYPEKGKIRKGTSKIPWRYWFSLYVDSGRSLLLLLIFKIALEVEKVKKRKIEVLIK